MHRQNGKCPQQDVTKQTAFVHSSTALQQHPVLYRPGHHPVVSVHFVVYAAFPSGFVAAPAVPPDALCRCVPSVSSAWQSPRSFLTQHATKHSSKASFSQPFGYKSTTWYAAMPSTREDSGFSCVGTPSICRHILLCLHLSWKQCLLGGRV